MFSSIRIILLIYLAAGPSIIWGQEIKPIISLHQNNSAGEPEVSGEVRVTGTVMGGGTNLLALGQYEIFIQDSSAGIIVLSPAVFQPGDSLLVQGQIFQQNGLTGLQANSAEYLGAGIQPKPRVLTCAQVKDAFDAHSREINESRLIRLNEVTIRNTTPHAMLIDTSGTCNIFLEPNLNVSQPTGKFTIIGLLLQIDSTSPFTENYFIMPRFSTDIIYHDAPRFLTSPLETDIQPYQVAITWETSSEASSVVTFGLTRNYESGRIGDSTLVQQHKIILTNLTPATVYHYRVISTNEYGAIQSADLLFSTASHPDSPGKINIYFSKSVDATVKSHQAAWGYVDLEQKLLNRIRAASYSIDMCIYSLSLDDVFNALVDAKRRGVSIRLITEAERRSAKYLLLSQAGIPIIDDEFGPNDGTGLMHNKFVVFDQRDQTSAADDWVWTGSYNFTYAANNRYAEHAIEIQDEALANCYTREFNEMWGSASETPDSTQSRFGARKTDNTPHVFNIQGIQVKQFMSPGDKVLNQLLPLIETANYNLRFCIFDFTLESVARTMELQRQRWPHFKVRGVFDRGQTFGNYNLYSTLKNTNGTGWDPPADVWRWRSGDLLHHKYLLIDADYPASNPVTATGSYNWSSSAENRNDENFLAIFDSTITNLFHQEFNARYHEAAGANQLASTRTVSKTCFLAQNFPNPFNSATRIRYYLEKSADVNLTIFNLKGQQLKQWQYYRRSSGQHTVTWSAKNEDGVKLSSGLYFCRLKTDGHILTRKILLTN